MQDPTPLCRIEMFGPLRVLRGDLRITRFVSQRAAGLLAYLALHGNRSHTRERLVDLLWPDLAPEAGRDNLTPRSPRSGGRSRRPICRKGRSFTRIARP